MFWLTSPIDPIWGGSQVGEFKGSKQTSVTGVFLPTDGDYSTLGSYQQNKLRRLIGRSPLGKWRLLVGDSEDLDDGLLFRWAIELACKYPTITWSYECNYINDTSNLN